MTASPDLKVHDTVVLVLRSSLSNIEYFPISKYRVVKSNVYISIRIVSGNMIKQTILAISSWQFLKTPAEKRITLDPAGKVVRDSFAEEASVSSAESERNSQPPSFSIQCNMRNSNFCPSILLSAILEAIQTNWIASCLL